MYKPLEESLDELESDIREICVCGVHPEVQKLLDDLREHVRIFDGNNPINKYMHEIKKDLQKNWDEYADKHFASGTGEK